ncbi:twin-arginine translocase subunit TatB [Rhodanobacter glycinis]|uniref:Sec-independent protein translocase protein TatB n=1 Tax=Rhodanobacter glycinis TaxID=582702 RepID=A0A502FDY9_9GAMM|nr:Sec-independent protein translocase protein TatB [Rhodanobacter glycinis]TPG11596.1 twin-arginine translocase subunit TatB [Rhodanobacter glycinis]TPG47551.1 twin-arginine translocase subunit TatB [Rhodanobacter glycinis]
MIEISLGKLVLLALIALIVLGPEKLPGAARTAGALLRRVRNGWDNVRTEVERELEIEQIKRTAREAAARAEAAQNEMKEGLQQVREPLERVAAEAVTMAHPESARAAESTDPALVCDDPADTMQAELPLGEPPALSESTRKRSHDDA